LKKPGVSSFNQQLNNFSDMPNPELMLQIASCRGSERRMHPSNFHVIKDMQDNDIRNLSKVIEKSITQSMTKGKYAISKRKQMLS
jgi:hypothetical protein